MTTSRLSKAETSRTSIARMVRPIRQPQRFAGRHPAVVQLVPQGSGAGGIAAVAGVRAVAPVVAEAADHSNRG
jgi:hypothetical protein